METKKQTVGGKFLRGGIYGAPAWAVILLTFALVLGIIKTVTDWPPFLSQLQIFGIGILLGLAAAIYAWKNEVKADKILKKSKDLQLDNLRWEQVVENDPNVDSYTYRLNPNYLLLNYGGNWAARLGNGQTYFLGAFDSPGSLNQAAENHYLTVRK